ncbi:hypothetical protein OG542_04610 [Streptomyces violaceus]|uniref:hypothetical protein n=1 Tax=Streptomyces violaceus TaxID=1936 RepID=UPI002E1CE08E
MAQATRITLSLLAQRIKQLTGQIDLLKVLAERAPATVVIRDFVMLHGHGEQVK